MRYDFPPDEGPLEPWWTEPLEMVERALAASTRIDDGFFDPHDFMIMTRLRRGPRPDVILYKHVHTRKYINLDDQGHAYRYFPPRSVESTRGGCYRRHRDLRTAVDDLRLWELPWMKPELEQYQLGFSWDDRWHLFDDATGGLLSERPAVAEYDRWMR